MNSGTLIKLKEYSATFSHRLTSPERLSSRLSSTPDAQQKFTSVGMDCSGGDFVNTWVEDGVKWKAHVFSTVGRTYTFDVNSWGSYLKDGTAYIDFLMIGGGGTGGSPFNMGGILYDYEYTLSGGGGAGQYCEIRDFPLEAHTSNRGTIIRDINIGNGGNGPNINDSVYQAGNFGESTSMTISNSVTKNNSDIIVRVIGGSGGGGGIGEAGSSTEINPPRYKNSLSYPSTISQLTPVTPTSCSGGGASISTFTDLDNGFVPSQSTIGNFVNIHEKGIFNESILSLSNPGGIFINATSTSASGGGGIGGRGANAIENKMTSNPGGEGIITTFDGTIRKLGGGGEGACWDYSTISTGGILYGGARGAASTSKNIAPSAALDNTGAGGGGGGWGHEGSNGGSGILIIRYRN
jgi:hypothetical protein